MTQTEMTKEEATEAMDYIMGSPCASYWLKESIKQALNRDCVDAWKDADLLTRILKARLRY